MSRAPGHERSAWAVETVEAQNLAAMIGMNAIMLHGALNNPDGIMAAERLAHHVGRRAGLAFRAAELVYDAEQRAASAERIAFEGLRALARGRSAL